MDMYIEADTLVVVSYDLKRLSIFNLKYCRQYMWENRLFAGSQNATKLKRPVFFSKLISAPKHCK